ncbi:hypothetical protein [Streptomyces minutiscleroticus]|uniref:hypothetical protein n=1 Tax=Streptomyces minutiscleroticus TaxID=68238 RepID=UPI00332E34E6
MSPQATAQAAQRLRDTDTDMLRIAQALTEQRLVLARVRRLLDAVAQRLADIEHVLLHPAGAAPAASTRDKKGRVRVPAVQGDKRRGPPGCWSQTT